MTLFSRCSDILVANMNSFLDRAEDPEIMIAQVIREMEDALATARGHAAGAIAAERWLQRELTKQRAGIDHWHGKARAAVAANRDDLARVALLRKKELGAGEAELAIQHAVALETSTRARAALDALDANLARAQRRQRYLIARNRAVQTRRALAHAAGKRLGADITLDAKLQHWDQRITALEDEAAAVTELQGLHGAEPTFGQWETEAEVDRALQALKEENIPK